jgi:hypothetical protein
MDRKSLLALLNQKLTGMDPRLAPHGAPARAMGARRPDEVYQAAQAIRSRIDAALDVSRRG